MDVNKTDGGYELIVAPASDPLLSEARVAADIIGAYWDAQTKGDDIESRFMARDLFRSGIGNMLDTFRNVTTKCQEEQTVSLTPTQMSWLGNAVAYYCEQPPVYDEAYEMVARQVGRALLLKLQEFDGESI